MIPDPLSPRAFTAVVREHVAALRQRIEADVSGLPDDKASVQKRRKETLADFQAFCRTYFPHYITGPPSKLHLYLYERLPALAASSEAERDAIAAPRGEAKSTLCAVLFPLWLLMGRRKKFIVLIQDALHQATLTLAAIKAELEANPRLAVDFRKEVGAGATALSASGRPGQPRTWQEADIVTAGGARVMALGSGKRLRGLRHGPHRPDLVVLDDIENDDNVRTPDQRDKLDRWVDTAVAGLGGAGAKCDIVYVGTILHYDSVLARKLRHPLWTAITFRAIEVWPARMDLWERWEELLRNQGAAVADGFYAANKAAMDEGAVVSWPEVRPILALMKKRVEVGQRAFDSEFMNDPVNVSEAVFGGLQFWVAPSRDWLFFGACDPSLGKANKGRDPSATLVGGLDRETGVLDVVEALIRRRLPDALIEDIIDLQLRYRCQRWAIETVQFQAFFASELVKRSAAKKIPVPVVSVEPHKDKQLRIEGLQPHVANGLIRVRADQTTLCEQLRHYPAADHDDGPDALEMLWTLAMGARAGVGYRGGGGRDHASALGTWGGRLKRWTGSW